MSTIASFKLPKVLNEPNHHYAKGSEQREGLMAAVERLRRRAPMQVPIVVGGKEVCTPSLVKMSVNANFYVCTGV